jgi:hypothetical protein
MKDLWMVSNLKAKYKTDDEMAHLLYFATKLNKAKVLTGREVPDHIKKDFKHVMFINPFEKLKKEIKIIEKGIEKAEKKAVKEIKKDIHEVGERIEKVVLHIRKSKHLEDYVKHAMNRGVSEEEIKEKMIKAGWTEAEVKYYLKNAKGNI